MQAKIIFYFILSFSFACKPKNDYQNSPKDTFVSKTNVVMFGTESCQYNEHWNDAKTDLISKDIHCYDKSRFPLSMQCHAEINKWTIGFNWKIRYVINIYEKHEHEERQFSVFYDSQSISNSDDFSSTSQSWMNKNCGYDRHYIAFNQNSGIELPQQSLTQGRGQMIRSAYRECLKREATDDEVRSWLNTDTNIPYVKQGICNSNEARKQASGI